MTYKQLQAELQAQYNSLFDKVGLFWAFSDEQFEKGKGKNPVSEGYKYVSIGMGGFYPGQNKQQYHDGIDKIRLWEKQANKELKKSREETEKAILYELNNHECFYTCNIDEVVSLFKGVYTRQQIRAVYKKANNKRMGAGNATNTNR